MRREVFAFLLVIALLTVSFRIASLPTPAQASSQIHIQFQTIQDNTTEQNSTQTSNVTLPISENEIDVDRTYYVPTTITLNYPATTATSLSNVTTVSGSGYNYAGTSTSFTFIADSIDVYSFTYTINYANASLHQILIATWEGDRAMQGETWSSVASTYVISFRLSMVTEPSYPSKQDVAQESMSEFYSMFGALLSASEASASAAENMSIASGLASTIAAVTAIIALLYVVTAEKKRRRLSTETT
jgi:hypothetical protein